MSWNEFWWVMRNDAEGRSDFIRNVMPPFLLLAILYAALIGGLLLN